MKDIIKITKQSYNKIAKAYAKENFDYKPVEHLLKKFIRLLPLNAHVLDVGCGPGVHLRYFVSRNISATGTDYSLNMIKAGKKLVPEAEFVKSDMRRLKLKSNSFDGLWAMSSLNFLPKRYTQIVLNEFRRVLKQNGILFISAPEGERKGFFDLFDKPVFSVAFKLNELRNLLIKSGFRIIEAKASVAKKGRAKGVKFVTIFAEVRK